MKVTNGSAMSCLELSDTHHLPFNILKGILLLYSQEFS